MRASEFTKQELDEKVNPRVVEPGFTAEKRLGNRYVMKAEARYTGEPGDDLRGLIIKVYDTKARPTMLNWGIGMTRFVARQDPNTQDWYLVSSTTHVDDRYQRQGLASAMYNWARELGNDIEPSSNRTKMGKHFWEKGAGAGREFVDQPPETAAPPAIPTSTAAGPAKAQSLRDRLVKMFTEEPGLAERKQIPLEDFEGLQFRMVNDNGQLFVNAFDSTGVNELGHVTFDMGDGKELDPQNLYVKHKFRSQGIAQIMYDFVKSKGYKIQRSWDQTDAGAGFWDKHRGEERVWEQDDSEARSHDFMAGHCHVMALALKQLHPDWQIRAHVGWDDDAADDAEYRVDHVYTVAPDGTAYDCRGRFNNEQQLVGPDTTGGVDTQYVNFGPEEIKQAMLRGELKRFTKQDLANAVQVGKQVVTEDAMMGKLEDSGKIVRILKKAHTVPFSDEKNWLLIDTDPAKGNKGLGLKWVPADTRFTWVRPYRDSMEEDSLTEIENMKQSQYRGGKDTLDRYSTPGKKHLRALPGGTDLMYSITSDAYGSYVHIVDPGIPGITKPSIVASLSLVKGVIPDSVQVGAITVDEDYRGRGLAKALYGIVLTIMKKTLISGSSQTPGGRRNWLSLASIPGVEIKGLLDLANFQLEKSKQVDNTIDQLMQLGGQFVARDNNYTYWAFDVVPGNGQLAPAVKNKLSKLYGYDSTNLLMATWTGGQQAVIEEINPDILNPRFSHTQKIGDYTYIASVEIFLDEPLLNIKAYDGDKEIGHVLFQIVDWEDGTSNSYMESGGTDVDPKYRGKGVAATMYAYAKMLGNDIIPSFNRTADGKAMWAGWGQDAKHLRGMTENFADGRHPEDKGDSQRHGIPKNATMAELEKASHAAGRKGQLARWQLNMRRGHKK